MPTNFLGIPIQAKRATWIKSIIISAIVSSLIALSSLSLLESCLLEAFQNIALPLIVAMFLIDEQSLLTLSQRCKYGAVLGGTIGAIGATSTLLMQSIGFYMLGGREVSLTEMGIPVPPLTPFILIRDILLLIPLWLIVVVASIIVGVIGAMLSSKRQRK